MKFGADACGRACFVGILLFAAAVEAQRGGPQPNRPDNARSLQHVATAKQLAADDPFLTIPFTFFCVPGNARAQNNNAPDLEPIKIFDNVYALGNSETSVYALTSSEGIVLLDAGFENKAELLETQLQKLALDPSRVKYILLGHGHADHFGGASLFQTKYRTKIASSAADWDLIDAPGARAAGPGRGGGAKPARDVVLAEGQPIQFGDLTITPVAIPGHTPGSLAFVFPVKEKGQTRMAGWFGGAVLTTGILTTDALKQYTQSIAHYLETAKRMNVEVALQNHPIFDGMPDRLSRLKAAGATGPHPFVIGNDRYIRMWTIVSECMQAEVARREGA